MPDMSWVQYGCFGLLAALVIWALVKGIPSVLETVKEILLALTETFKAAVAEMLKSNKEEAAACRAERAEAEKTRAVREELDRKSRHELTNAVQKLMALYEIQQNKLEEHDQRLGNNQSSG